MQNSCPDFIFLIDKHWKFTHTKIAYHFRRCHEFDPGSVVQVEVIVKNAYFLSRPYLVLEID